MSPSPSRVIVRSRWADGPLVIGDWIDGLPVIEVEAIAVYRSSRIGDRIWITGTGAEDVITGGFFRRITPPPVPVAAAPEGDAPALVMATGEQTPRRPRPVREA